VNNTIICPECGAFLELRVGQYGVFYGCKNWPKCDVTQKADDDGNPVGMPSNGSTKKARIEAHDTFDLLWKEGHMSRDHAYLWMQEIMGLTSDDAHIAKFNPVQCTSLISAVKVFLERDGHLIKIAEQRKAEGNVEEDWDSIVDDFIADGIDD
jgi:ssDNA-binding Zn-finger/Zn-ribbon topoisomerase 1